jgi:hypothetical protein
VPKPEQKTNNSTEDQRTTKEPSSFRDSYKAHQEYTDDNDQPDWMPSEQTSAVASEREHLSRIGFSIVRGNFPSTTASNVAEFLHQLPYTPARCAVQTGIRRRVSS